ncbi:MAG TPA: tetratricopeptide repeat protein [Chthonomonadaceae bacterium]|nr:tetratricopeptide repeat protein [Chthonomonadaceae bacterium]
MNTQNAAPSPSDASLCPPGHATRPSWQRCLRRAEEQIEEQQYGKAIASLNRAMAAGADDYDCTLRIAGIYREIHQWPRAFATVEKAIHLDPARLPAYEMWMEIAMEAGDPERALAASQALLKIAPRHIPAHDTLSSAYMQLGDVDAAMRVINRLVRLDPRNAAHHFKKGLLCQHKGQVGLAAAAFMQAVRLEPEGPHSEAAQEALDALDAYQLSQIFILALDDPIFRAKLTRNAVKAVHERGFLLTELGNLILAEFGDQTLSDLPPPCRPIRYN